MNRNWAVIPTCQISSNWILFAQVCSTNIWYYWDDFKQRTAEWEKHLMNSSGDGPAVSSYEQTTVVFIQEQLHIILQMKTLKTVEL